MRFRWAVFFLAAATLVTPNVLRGTGAPAFVEFPFEFRAGLNWLEVHLEGNCEPLNFLLDSGANISVLHEQTARRLAVKLGKRVKVHGVGVETTGYWPQKLRARVGPVLLPKEYLVVDLTKLSEACLCTVDGLVGRDFIDGRVVQIDYPEHKIRLLAHPPAATCATILPLRRSAGGFQVPVRVNGETPRWVRLDTGCASALQWTVSDLVDNETSDSISVGLTQLAIPVIPTAVELGGLRFENVLTGLHTKNIFPGEPGLLGNRLLAKFRVTLDTVHGLLVLEEAPAR